MPLGRSVSQSGWSWSWEFHFGIAPGGFVFSTFLRTQLPLQQTGASLNSSSIQETTLSETKGGTGTPHNRLPSGGSSLSGDILSKLRRSADVGDSWRSISLNLFMNLVKSIVRLLTQAQDLFVWLDKRLLILNQHQTKPAGVPSLQSNHVKANLRVGVGGGSSFSVYTFTFHPNIAHYPHNPTHLFMCAHIHTY